MFRRPPARSTSTPAPRRAGRVISEGSPRHGGSMALPCLGRTTHSATCRTADDGPRHRQPADDGPASEVLTASFDIRVSSPMARGPALPQVRILLRSKRSLRLGLPEVDALMQGFPRKECGNGGDRREPLSAICAVRFRSAATGDDDSTRQRRAAGPGNRRCESRPWLEARTFLGPSVSPRLRGRRTSWVASPG